MGKIREFTCPSCQKSWRINVGHGLRHATLENVIQAFPPEIQQKIKETAAKEQLPLFEFHYSAALCAQCQAVVSVPVIRFLQTGKQYTGVCPDCGSANSASLNDDLNGDSNSGIRIAVIKTAPLQMLATKIAKIRFASSLMIRLASARTAEKRNYPFGTPETGINPGNSANPGFLYATG